MRDAFLSKGRTGQIGHKETAGAPIPQQTRDRHFPLLPPTKASGVGGGGGGGGSLPWADGWSCHNASQPCPRWGQVTEAAGASSKLGGCDQDANASPLLSTVTLSPFLLTP